MNTWKKINGKARHYIAVGLLIALMPMVVSCYGHFPLTKAIYRMNSSVGNDIGEDRTQSNVAKSVVMWILVIIPVYQVGMIADVVILNLVEFWSGDAVEIGMVQERDGTQVSLSPTVDGREAVLTVSRNGKMLVEQHVVKVSDTRFEMRDASGKLTGAIVKTPEGAMHLTDAKGQVIRTLAAEDLTALRSSM